MNSMNLSSLNTCSISGFAKRLRVHYHCKTLHQIKVNSFWLFLIERYVERKNGFCLPKSDIRDAYQVSSRTAFEDSGIQSLTLPESHMPPAKAAPTVKWSRAFLCPTRAHVKQLLAQRLPIHQWRKWKLGLERWLSG